MFERFNEPARAVVVRAQDEARALKHPAIGTEHVLLGLLADEKGVPARTLARFNLTLDELRAEVERAVAPGPEAPGGRIPFTRQAKKTLELSLRQCLALGHTSIAPEHMLLGLLRHDDSTAVAILARLGAGRLAVAKRTLALMDERAPGLAERLMAHPIQLGTERAMTLAFPSARPRLLRWLALSSAFTAGALTGWLIWG